MKINEAVASVTLSAVLPSGEGRVISIQIGKPYQKGDHWRCPVAIPGMNDSLPDIAGEDAFQSLCLAMRLVRNLLQDFRARGGKLTYPETGEDWPLEAYFSVT